MTALTDTEEFLRILFRAKCTDQQLSSDNAPSSTRLERFSELVRSRIRPPLLDLSYLGLGPESVSAIVAYVSSCSSSPADGESDVCDGAEVNSLVLSGNAFGDSGAMCISELLSDSSRSSSLTHLDLGGCEIGYKGCQAIFDALCGNRHLTSLDLSAVPGGGRNRLGTKGTEALTRCLAANPVLARLSLGDASLGIEVLPGLMEAVRASSLTWLDVSSDGVTDDSLSTFATCGPETRLAFEGLIASACGFGPRGAASLAGGLHVSPFLRELDLSGNKLGNVGVSHLAGALRNHPSLSSLRLDSNDIGPSGFASLVELYPPFAHGSGNQQRPTTTDKRESTPLNVVPPPQVVVQQQLMQRPLQNLSVAHNRLDSRSGGDAAIIIGRSPRLAFLDLGFNELGDAGVISLSGAIASEGCALRVINLCNNGLTDRACTALSNVLDINRTVRRLELSRNRLIGDIGCDAITTSLEGNTSLERVALEFTTVTYHSHVLLEEKLARNRRAHKAAPLAKVAGQVKLLKGGSEWMRQLTDRAEAARKNLEEVQGRLDKTHSELRSTEDTTGEERRKWEVAVAERTQKIQDVSNAVVGINSELGMVKTEKEATYKALLLKLHKEKDSSLRTGKKLADAQRQLADLADGGAEEIARLEAALKIELADRKSAQESVDGLRSSTERLRRGKSRGASRQSVKR